MVDASVANGDEGHYNVVDWRSWELARSSRSTLSAESQAASEAADSLLFTCTFWNLLWEPWLPLDALTTAKPAKAPHLVVDAKSLYDMLSKPEVQASSGTDKRTTMEVLVTQDKLVCCGATTKWVSSEQQYADGLTKHAAAQLLAERLRSHPVKLKSDQSFQAAKKKTPQERKKNAEMFAIKKPKRALAAMFSTGKAFYSYNLEMIETAAEEERFEEASNPATASVEIQTDMEMHDVVSFRDYWEATQRLEHYIENETVPHNIYDAMMATHHRELDVYYEALYENTRRMGLQERQHRANLHNLTQAPVYFTRQGRCWHAHPECLRRLSSTEIIQKEYCTRCAHTLGGILQPDEEPSTAAGAND
eukprot:s2481_g18.t1